MIGLKKLAIIGLLMMSTSFAELTREQEEQQYQNLQDYAKFRFKINSTLKNGVETYFEILTEETDLVIDAALEEELNYQLYKNWKVKVPPENKEAFGKKVLEEEGTYIEDSVF